MELIEKIYFDMDGVLADFQRGVKELAGVEPLDQSTSTEEEDKLMWEKIASVPHFYDRLELMPGAKEMFDHLYGKYGDKCEILTGIPKPKRGIQDAGADKISWVRRNLSKDIKVNIVYSEDKKNYCTGSRSILIDDLYDNLMNWFKMGGTPIRYVSAKDVLGNIESINSWVDVIYQYDSEEYRKITTKYVDEIMPWLFYPFRVGQLNSRITHDINRIFYAWVDSVKKLGIKELEPQKCEDGSN